VPLGRDLPLVANLVGGTAALVTLGAALRGGLVDAVRQVTRSVDATPFALLPRLAAGPALVAAAVCAAAGAGAALVTLVQTKGGFWPERVGLDLSRVLNPARVLNMFGRTSLTELGIGAVKVLALGWAGWSGVHADFVTLPTLLQTGVAEQLAFALGILWKCGWRMLLVAAVLAGVDLALVRKRYMKSMLVTKQEAAREAKDDMGDPLIRGKRRKRHRELSRGRAKVEVPRADALLVNPTHVAIALRYRKDEGRAPRVIAKGKGALAEYMRDLARENAIPIVQDIPLARLLYRKVKVGHEVPAATYKAVAAVLAFVYRVTGRAPGGRASA
jgi:flagellar biosynthesis protein FlhB